MPCGRKRRRARAQDPLVAVGGQLHFQVDWLNTREDWQLNSNNKDLKNPQATHISYARSFLNCQQVWARHLSKSRYPRAPSLWLGIETVQPMEKSSNPCFGVGSLVCESLHPQKFPPAAPKAAELGTPELSPLPVLVMPGITPITKFSKGELKASRF